MWQGLREELTGSGFELVTVALETRGWAEAARWVEAAQPRHPSLLDDRHLLGELYGVVNVPTGIWIDEQGRLVRPPETAFPGRSAFGDQPLPEGVSDRTRDVLEEARKLNTDGRPYVAALRDWVRRGAASRFALAPDEVLRRLAERSPEASRAGAHFELARHLELAGDSERAVEHFKAAHRLAPRNWTHKRQAWSLVDRRQAPNEVYDTGWLEDVRAAGPETYYPLPDL